MITSIPLRGFLGTVLTGAMCAMEEVLERSIGQPMTFIAPTIELRLLCDITYRDYSLQVTPSNAFVSNCYGVGNSAMLNVRLALKPR